MSAGAESVSSNVQEEVIDGLVIRRHDARPLVTRRGISWLTEYIAGAARFEVIHNEFTSAVPPVERQAAGWSSIPLYTENHKPVWMSWSSRILPAQLPEVAKHIQVQDKWRYDGPRPRDRVGSEYEELRAGGISVRALLSTKAETEGRYEVVLSYDLGTIGTAYLTEMLADRTADYDLIPHLPRILEREHDLLT